MGALQLVLGAVRLALPDPWTAARVMGVVSALMLGLFFLSLPWQHRYYGRRAERAEELNERLLSR